MVACRKNGRETAMRLKKHFSNECEDYWKEESGLVNALGEAEHPNVLTYCWHCKGMYLADFFSFIYLLLFFFFGNFNFCVEFCLFGGYLGKLGKNPSARTRSRTYDIPRVITY